MKYVMNMEKMTSVMKKRREEVYDEYIKEEHKITSRLLS